MVSIGRAVIEMIIGIVMIAFTLGVGVSALDTQIKAGGSLYWTTPTTTETAVMNIAGTLPVFAIIGGLVLVVTPILQLLGQL
jgi:hypothetical protein